MERKYLDDKIRELGKRQGSKWIRDKLDSGTIVLKRQLLGACGTKTTKTLDELAESFIKLRLAESLEEVHELADYISEISQQRETSLTYLGNGARVYIRFYKHETLDTQSYNIEKDVPLNFSP